MEAAISAKRHLTYSEKDELVSRATRWVEWNLGWTRASAPDTDPAGIRPGADERPTDAEKLEKLRAWPSPPIFLDHTAECMPDRDCAGDASGSFWLWARFRGSVTERE